VLFSLLAQGLTLAPLLRRLRLSGERSPASDFHRLAGERLSCEAGLGELARLTALGVVSRSTQSQLKQEYEERIHRLEEESEALHLSDEVLMERRLAEARLHTLTAEKSALVEAERSGLLDEEDYRILATSVDSRLDALHQHLRGADHAEPPG